MININGTKYTNTYTIPAYRSVVLMPDPNPGTPPDTQIPLISSFTLPTTSTSLTINFTAPIASDNTAVTGYLLTENNTEPSPASGSWTSSSPTTYTFSSQGIKTLYLWVKDEAGNVSLPSSQSITITLPIVNNNTGGGGGGSSYASPTNSIPPTSQSSASQTDTQLKAKQKDIKQDGHINIIDFNIIMANWGKTYSKDISLSKGDMTGDGKIDIFDINQLMVYWDVKYTL
jgi:hypothetical protein